MIRSSMIILYACHNALSYDTLIVMPCKTPLKNTVILTESRLAWSSTEDTGQSFHRDLENSGTILVLQNAITIHI